MSELNLPWFSDLPPVCLEMNKGKHTEEQVRGVLKQVEAGWTLKATLGEAAIILEESVRRHGLKELEDENRRPEATHTRSRTGRSRQFLVCQELV
jgi:hypothetical protein